MTTSPVSARAVAIGLWLLASLSAQQAQFVPIPGASSVPGSNPNFCGLSGSAGYSGVRVSADGTAVATVTYAPGFTNGAVPQRGARWTAATGTVELTGDLLGNYGVVGISADGQIVYGESWRWRANGGYQNLLPQLTPRLFQTRILFGCAHDGRIVTGIEGIQPADADLLLWDLDNAPPQVLPRPATFPTGYFYFNTVSGDGRVVGGAARRPTTNADEYAGVVVTPAGANVITADSEQCGVTSLSFDGSIAVGFIEESARVRAFRWSASAGLQYLDATGPARDGSYARAISADGGTIVGDYLRFGQPRTRAFWWTPSTGLVDLRDELVTAYGLGAALAGWQLITATDVSGDGRVLVGQGVNPSGCEQAFLVRLPQVVGQVSAYGNACAGPTGTLTLSASSAPYVGATFVAQCSGATTQSLQLGVFGLTSLALPLSSLSPVGQVGCALLTSLDYITALPVAGGSATASLPIPGDRALAGLPVHAQVLQIDASAAGALRALRSSNGLRLTIGAF